MAAARLFYEKSSDGVERQRLLLLTHYFPPSEAIGALRWHRFVAIFAEHGWNMDVLTVRAENASAAALDELPAGTRVWVLDPPEVPLLSFERAFYGLFRRLRPHAAAATAAAEPRGATAPATARPEVLRREDAGWRLSTLRGWVRLWFTARDLFVSRAWVRRVTAAAEAIAEPGVHRAVITSGPPHQWHDAGRRVASHARVPLVIDLRDPWSTADMVHEYFATPAWLRVTGRQERRAVDAAALIVANTDALRAVMAQRFPDAASRMITVMNGYDDEPLPRVERARTFTIGYAGSIYHGRDPRPLFAGAARVVRERGLEPGDLQLRFIGDTHYAGVPLTTLAEEAGIPDHVHVGGRVSRGTAQRFMASCRMLVSIPWDDRLTIPAKLFEYVRYEAWLLVFAQPGSATARLMQGHDADVITPGDVTAVAQAIGRRYDCFREGGWPAPLSTDSRLSRRAQAAALLGALHPFRPVGPTDRPADRRRVRL
jgi:hypothetical protein